MTSCGDIDHILSIYSENEFPELSSYLSKLKDYKNGVKKSLREECHAQLEEKKKNKIKRPVNRHGIINWVNSRDELYRLNHARRQLTIVNMALIHYEQEMKAGHVVKNRKTKDFRHHEIPEVDSYIFKTKCPPYHLPGEIETKSFDDKDDYIFYVENEN